MNIVVLISGNGSNLQAILDANIRVAAVISNEPDSYGLERARTAYIPAHIINHHDFQSRDDFDSALQKQINMYQPDLIVLAGFMRRLGTTFVEYYAGKIINIHPSLLPKYPGLHTHRNVLKHKDREHGTSIHFVTSTLDAGPLIAQSKLMLTAKDTEDTLTKQVQALEHVLYPKIIKLIVDKRIHLNNKTVLLDGKPINPYQVWIEAKR